MNRGARALQILEEALQLEGEARERLLRERCGDDHSLLEEVRSLMAHDAAEDTYLDTPPGSTDSLARMLRPGIELPAGTRLGPWVLREAIASGGMGTVFRAERADLRFEMTVAIKLIKAGLDSAEVLARFENERRVLAGLEHPGIARLIDAGASEDGRPYFVMEYVRGHSIRAYARTQRLDLSARIELLARVCDAVQAAHRLSIVHRDLKPDNILVTQDGDPKLLDFGIAKVLAGERREGEDTVGPTRMMTPEYASPEHVRGETVAEACDVYSLGVVLYELLTGRRPHDFSGATRAEIERIASTREPDRPSTTALEEQARELGENPRTLRAHLVGDLDTIVLRALHKEPSRRYASAAELADDLRRHLAHEPVLARPDSRAYRLSRSVRRHRVPVVAALVVTLALAVGLALQLVERDRTSAATAVAEERSEDLRALARRLLFDLDAVLESSGASIAEREEAVKAGLEHLASLALRATDDPELKRDLVRGHVKIGDLLGGALVSNLGRPEEARENYERALVLAEGFDERDPGAVGLHALALHRLGALEETAGSLDEAMRHYQRALELGAVLGEDVDSAQVRIALTEVHSSLVSHGLRTGNHAAALDHAEQMLALVDHPLWTESDSRFHVLAIAMSQLGSVLALVGRDEEAEPMLRNGLEVAGDAFAARPRSAVTARARVGCLLDLAKFLYPRDGLEECLTLLEEAAALLRETSEADPDDVQLKRDLGVTFNLLSHVCQSLGENERGLVVGREYRDLALRLVEEDPEHFDYRADLVGARLAFSRAHSSVGEHELALEECLLAKSELEELARQRPVAGIRRNVASVSVELGRLYRARADATLEEAARAESLGRARDAFQDGLERMIHLRDEGVLAASDERYIDDVRERVRECDQTLRALSAEGAVPTH